MNNDTLSQNIELASNELCKALKESYNTCKKHPTKKILTLENFPCKKFLIEEVSNEEYITNYSVSEIITTNYWKDNTFTPKLLSNPMQTKRTR